ncbi:ECF RNA polymerase sigma factor SigW [Oceanibacterium hippocampi]|uniref:ECF RNA polymerase sigma factor SigW n=2 Tax=Oceanibacterium hippocampi TaxID=745714 RepID=A0A1Y5SU62_9PROT|nr:RNA polymerase sigma factor [Oceanibacterium hippocampi]SLN45237.1 ECF RNA polymerase sigma factor SigW [Oceanibacterium hippocampi]
MDALESAAMADRQPEDPGTRESDDARASDAALMRRVAAGDQAASRALVMAELPRIHALATRLLGDSHEAEDVSQEAFLRLWKQAADWRPEARVGTWLYRVARNLCVDRMRRRGSEAARPGDDDGTLERLADPAPDPAERYRQGELGREIDAALGRLPERQASAMHLVHYLEFGNIEAAKAMQVSVEALESLLSRARRTLRDRLGHLRDEFGPDRDREGREGGRKGDRT